MWLSLVCWWYFALSQTLLNVKRESWQGDCSDYLIFLFFTNPVIFFYLSDYLRFFFLSPPPPANTSRSPHLAHHWFHNREVWVCFFMFPNSLLVFRNCMFLFYRNISCTHVSKWSWQKWLFSWMQQKSKGSFWRWKEVLATPYLYQVFSLNSSELGNKLIPLLLPCFPFY